MPSASVARVGDGPRPRQEAIHQRDFVSRERGAVPGIGQQVQASLVGVQLALHRRPQERLAGLVRLADQLELFGHFPVLGDLLVGEVAQHDVRRPPAPSRRPPPRRTSNRSPKKTSIPGSANASVCTSISGT